MKFRTEIIPNSQNQGISYSDHTIFMGSCFSENIHNKMESVKLNVSGNPYGIVYNPISLARQLKEITEIKTYSPDDLQFKNERWFSYQHHSDYSYADPQECCSAMNTSIQQAFKQFQMASHLFITLGTAWAYSIKETGEWVSNCHKVPARNFDKSILEVTSMVDALSKAIKAIQKINPRIQIVCSVSPVRHLSDGAFENQLSKGRLFEVIHQLRSTNNHITYFNAYELIMDDLRDYRFFANDLVHPSMQAISYVWEKFGSVFFSTQTLKSIQKVEKLIQASNHRPFHPKSEAHQKFIEKSILEMEKLERELTISFQTEKERIGLNA